MRREGSEDFFALAKVAANVQVQCFYTLTSASAFAGTVPALAAAVAADADAASAAEGARVVDSGVRVGACVDSTSYALPALKCLAAMVALPVALLAAANGQAWPQDQQFSDSSLPAPDEYQRAIARR